MKILNDGMLKIEANRFHAKTLTVFNNLKLIVVLLKKKFYA